ncbi:MAG: hypothetical protein ACF8R7_17870 [Phycisphaerales bacterium JB039]
MGRPRRMMIAGIGLTGGLLALVAFYGCRSLAVAVYPAPQTSLQAVELTQRESGLRVGPLAEQGSLSAEAMWAPRPRRDQFLRFRSGDSEPDTVLRRTTIPQPADPPLRRIDLFVDTEQPETTSALQRSADGAIEITASNGAGIASTFEPAALLLPAELRAGETIERDFEVSSRGKPFGRGAGAGVATVRGMGRQVIQVPAGVYSAFVFESEIAFKIGPAHITLGQRAWVAPDTDGPGLVAEEGWERVTVFGLGVHDTKRVSVLEAADVAEPAPASEDPQ